MFCKRNILIIISAVLIVFFELISRFPALVYSKPDTLEAIFSILKEDPVLFWKQRAYLNTKFQGRSVFTNSLGFRNSEISINKTNQTYRIFCLGASPTFGWGVNSEDTYPFLLEQNLKQTPSLKKIEVINAGEIGYSTHQGLILLEKYLLKYSPDLVTISYVLNDIDRYKFFRNEGLRDGELGSEAYFITNLRNMLRESKICALLKKAMVYLINKNVRLTILTLKKQFGLAKVRVSAEDYKSNLEKFVSICNAHRIKVIFVKMPINLFLPKLSFEENDILNRGYNVSQIYYERGCNYEKNREYEKAKETFKKAKDYLVFECVQDGKLYQQLMEEVAYKYNIPLVDAAKIFVNEGKNQNLFNILHDPIHPNSMGHKIIANAISTKISEYNLLE